MSLHIIRFTMGAIIGCSPFHTLPAPCSRSSHGTVQMLVSVCLYSVSPGGGRGGRTRLDLVFLHVWYTVGIAPGEPMGALGAQACLHEIHEAS